jgi:predicted phosphodiesterase
MRIAIISDIHGNLAALEAVLRDLDHQEVGEVLVGGDLAEGGRQPGEVLDLLMARGWPAVVGNADALLLEVAGGRRAETEVARTTAVWTVSHVRPDHLDYLRSLPLSFRRVIPGGGELVLIHATPWSVEEMVPPDAPEEVARRMLSEGRARVVVYGHIHSAYQRTLPEGLLVSVGGVSGSNDRDPRPTYSILTLGAEVTVEVRRVAYDVERELAAIERAGLPLVPELRRWLRSGGPWPVRA